MIVVGTIIKNHNNELLLQQRDDKAPAFKNCWTLFGGIVENNETPEEAILRELLEEIRLSNEHIESIKQIAKKTVQNR